MNKQKRENMYKTYASARLDGKQDIISSFFLVYPFLRDKIVLDVGCSDGLYLKLFAQGSVGIEQIQELARVAQQKGFKVMHGDILSVLPQIAPDSYHAIFCSHVLEHLENPIEALRQMHRILTPQGYLVLGLPTEKNIFRLMLRKDYFAGTHLYSFSVKNIIKLLNLENFNTIDKIKYDLPKCKSRIGRLIIRLYQYFPFKECLSMAYWVVAKKK